MTGIYDTGYVICDREISEEDRNRVSEICKMKLGRKVAVFEASEDQHTTIRVQVPVHDLHNYMRFPNEGERVQAMILDPLFNHIVFTRDLTLSHYKITVATFHKTDINTILHLDIEFNGFIPGVSDNKRLNLQLSRS